jgi:hypothetical protein
MRIAYDAASRGVWCICEGCGFHGGIIELAAKVWDIDIESTIRKLYGLGTIAKLPQSLEHHIEGHLAYLTKRARFKAFWEKSRKRLVVDYSTTMRGLQHKLGLKSDMSPERWLAGPGLFIGGADHEELERQYVPGIGYRGERYYRERLFHGPYWHDVLVSPLVDMPGRVKGFMACGRGLNLKDDVVYRPWCAVAGDNDAGLLYYLAGTRRPEYQDTIFAFSEPFTALRLHFWHAQDNSDILPIVAFVKEGRFRTKPVIWGTLPPGPLVFWGPPEDLGALIRHARLCNGLIGQVAWPSKHPIAAFTRRTPSAWLHAIRESAVPWEVALERALTGLPTNKGEELFLKSELMADDRERFLMGCPADLQDAYRHYGLTPRRIKLDTQEIIETDGTWVLAKNKEVISDAIIRLEHAVFHPQKHTIYHTGRVLFRNQDIPFVEADDVIRVATANWLRSVIVKAGLGYPQISSKYTRKLLEIATRFHKPESAKAFTDIGWDDEQGCFVFANFVVRNGGAVETIADGKVLIVPSRADYPTMSIEKPVGLTAEEVNFLSEDNPHNRLLWACGMGLLAGALYPVLNERPRGIAVTGPAAPVGISVFQLMGCLKRTTESPFGWPVIFTFHASGHTDRLRVLLQPEAPNTIYQVNEYAAKAICCRPGWHALFLNEYVGSARPLLDIAPKLIPNFIQHLAKHHFQLVPADGPVSAIANELKEWFDELGGNVGVIDAAMGMYREDHEAAEYERTSDAFFDILCALFDAGKFVIVRENFYPPKTTPTMVLLEGGNQLYISMLGLNRHLQQHQAPPVDTDMVTRALTNDKVLEGIMRVRGHDGWVIKEDVWDRKITAWRARMRKSFRTVG